MEFGAKSMAVTNNANVDINFDMDEVLKRIQSSRNVAGVMVINNEGKHYVVYPIHLKLAFGWYVCDIEVLFFMTWHILSIFSTNFLTGIPLKSTLDSSTTVQYGGMVSDLAAHARSIVRDLDPTNELTFLRVKSTKHEVLVAPDDSFIIIVLQNTREEE